MKKYKIAIVTGARPNFIKAISLLSEFKKHSKIIKPILIHTGQHYDYLMSQVFFKDLSIPSADFYLNVRLQGKVATQVARTIIQLEKAFIDIQPNLVLVVGDVNSTLAGALTASKLNIPLAHVEAGLRSFDKSMPEEINRIIVDAISNFHFTTSQEANENLINEGIDPGGIFLVGNVMIDTLYKNKKNIGSSKILEKIGLKKSGFALMTLHRPSNVDSKEHLSRILSAILEISKSIPIIFPVHPRTRKMIKTFKLTSRFYELPIEPRPWRRSFSEMKRKIILLSPIGYIDFQALLSNARFVMTDSGGIQEEATIWKIPCLTLRYNTERNITVDSGTNKIIGTHAKDIIEAAEKILTAEDTVKNSKRPRFWDGHAAERIVKILINEENIRNN